MADSVNRRHVIQLAAASAVAGLVPCVDPYPAPATPSSRAMEDPSPLPVGRWCVEFTNEVIQLCEIRSGGEAFVRQPHRKAGGTAAIKDGKVVIDYQDDRIERWGAVGRRMVVEHWCPSTSYPSGSPVLGIAERLR